jgi:hypothetical protein
VIKIKRSFVNFVRLNKGILQTRLLDTTNLPEFRFDEIKMKKSQENNIIMSDKPNRRIIMNLADKLFKLSSYFILTSVFSLFKKFEKIGSTDEISQVHLSLGELNNKYQEINPEQDEFNPNTN